MAWSFLNPFRNSDDSSDGRKSGEEHGAYRKCPKCGERDFRIIDKQRAEPQTYRSRLFRVKWLCLACGMRESEQIEEPG